MIGVTGVVLWPFLAGKQVNLPFKRNGSVAFKTAEQVEKERMDQLRKMDTDSDGLTDYDELYLFRTSPFLSDSDSDGIVDGAEVAQDTDPNCPQGQTCRQVRSTDGGGLATSLTPTPAQGGTSVSGGGSVNPAGGTSIQPGDAAASDEERYMQVITETFGDPDKLTPDSIKAGIQKMSNTQLRSFLGKLGIPAQALQKADDATLRQLVSETLNEIATSSATDANANTP